MFVTFLRFVDNRSAAPEFMAVHNDWIARGFTDGVFLCVGSLQPAVGGDYRSCGKSRRCALITFSTLWIRDRRGVDELCGERFSFVRLA
ncbi:hypothetical protein NXT3_PC00306 (plasmid) [Sinorhizobium fredii]|uniref:YCII-related domain-containing protein n=1 Tax=Rhizobium fredii TaxID=380 RepID=A0A2L0HFC6_RHIFR|nr:hypothetical protein NXT3_PC00306 [Sinorhizobium fredii]